MDWGKLLNKVKEEVETVRVRHFAGFFLWLWLKGMPITDEELYQRLKKRGVLVVPGHYFFPGLKAEWNHKRQCIRINYAQDEEIVSAGLNIIADEVKRAYDSA